ncbi:MAG: ABC transporter ATP-binding protein, partial [Clostridiales bacterium]|nr:ABC transporter ATP-binding protein [Clostridiales bacterium]
GKSTTISILCGQLSKDSGVVKVQGVSVGENDAQIKKSLGVVFQNSVLDSKLSVYDNLCFRAALYGITGADFTNTLNELTELFSLGDILKRPLCKLSGGQKRRVDIARAMLHRPSILILDEPTTGLDPQTRRMIWDVIEGIRKERNMTVLLTTHYMEEAANADYVVIIDGGKKVAEGTPLDLKNAYTGDFITLYGSMDKEKVLALGYPTEEVSGALRIAVPNTAAATELIVKHPALFTDYEVTKGCMDDVFLAVTGKKLGGAQ